jgi:hypothetical protein
MPAHRRELNPFSRLKRREAPRCAPVQLHQAGGEMITMTLPSSEHPTNTHYWGWSAETFLGG